MAEMKIKARKSSTKSGMAAAAAAAPSAQPVTALSTKSGTLATLPAQPITAHKTSAKSGNGRVQTFSIKAANALSVQLVGDFTQWKEKPINLRKDVGGIWRASVELPPGTHHYRFLVDGQWTDDPECTLRSPNPFGGQNMLRKVA